MISSFVFIDPYKMLSAENNSKLYENRMAFYRAETKSNLLKPIKTIGSKVEILRLNRPLSLLESQVNGSKAVKFTQKIYRSKASISLD